MTTRRLTLLFATLGLGILGGLLLLPTRPPTTDGFVPVAWTLGGDAAGYAQAMEPQSLEFPRDHGPHPDFRNEWWYLTGNLATPQGRRFGYQLTLFRNALSPKPTPKDSAWRTRQVYMGHFAVTDMAGGRHFSFERYARAALGLAGARATPFRVWLEDWSLDGGDALFPLRLRAAAEGVALELTLETTKPLILQGEQGLSRRSGESGHGSYYYSFTRLPSQGQLRLNGYEFQVAGSSWLDREWSSQALGPEQTGWDWFALQLDDGRDLMFYRLRHQDGGMDPFSAGVLVGIDGAKHSLGPEDVILEPLDTWTSPRTGDRYPVRWRLAVPEAGLELSIEPRLEDQEMQVTFRYWEGAVSVSGTASGQGYLEMTRYEPPKP